VVITIITMIISCSITWHVLTSLSLHTLSIEVSTRVSSIIQNQTRAFREPNPPPGYVVCFLSFLERGFRTPAGRLIRAILHYYGVELHNLNPNSVM